MLEFLLRHVTLRNLVIAGVAMAALPFAGHAIRSARGLYMQTMYPPVKDSADADIRMVLDQREGEKVQSRYRRAVELIDQARSLGYDVDALTFKANRAIANNIPGRRDYALQLLAEIEMAAPRQKPQDIPLYTPAPNDTMSDEDEAPAAKPGATKTKPPKEVLKKRKKSKHRAAAS